MSNTHIQLIRRLYERFNARDITGVLEALADDVIWANAMEGGYVHGHEEIRDYWTRQWAMVSPHVEPVTFENIAEGVAVEVNQSVFDLTGQLLSEQVQGLKNKTVVHLFKIQDNKVVRFDVEER